MCRWFDSVRHYLTHGLLFGLMVSAGNAVLGQGLPKTLSLQEYQAVEEPNDWVSAPDIELAAFSYPSQGVVVTHNPPHFVWPWPDENQKDLLFDLEIRYPNHVVKHIRTSNAWVSFWPGALYPTHLPYAWRVRAVQKNDKIVKNWSDWRFFYVGPDAPILSIPNIDQLYRTASTKTRPRTFPQGEALAQLKRQYLGARAPFKKEWDALLYELKEKGTSQPVNRDPQIFLQAGRTPVQVTTQEIDLAMLSALAWGITGEREHRDRAIERTLNLAAWQNSNRFPCDWTQGIVCRRLNMNLALLYDWLYPVLSSAQKKTIRSAIFNRLGEVNGMQYFTPSLYKAPLDSWGEVAHIQITMVAALMAGEDKIYETLFKKHVPLYLNRPNLWGAEDGVFGNGMGYSAFNIRKTLMSVYVLSETTGYPIDQLPFLQHYPYFWVYFQPFVQPALIYSPDFHVPGFFGDGGENFLMSAYLLPGFNAVLSHLNRTPLIQHYDWALNQEKNRVPDWVWMVKPVASSPAPNGRLALPDSILFPLSGWVAMHSDLFDRDRVSVYFKATRYGSISHNHADQNHVVVHAGGIPLLIDSGFYDSFVSTHHKNWYEQTKAHNAVTFDGGIGQVPQSRKMSGFISRYYYDANKGVTMARGDATKAYGGALTKAHRTLYFMKPDTLIILDELASKTQRLWEANFHTTNRMTPLSGASVKIEDRGKTACLTFYSQSPVRFEQTNDFGLSNQDSPTTPTTRQWHGRFSTLLPTETAKFLTVIRVGCPSDNLVLTSEGEQLKVTAHGSSIYLPRAGNIPVSALRE